MKTARRMGKNSYGNDYYILQLNGGSVYVSGVYDSSLSRTTFIQTHHNGQQIDGTAYKIVYGDSVEDCVMRWGFQIHAAYQIQCSPEVIEDLRKMEQDEDDRTWEQKAKEKQNEI